jgi:hypothetical protein
LKHVFYLNTLRIKTFAAQRKKVSERLRILCIFALVGNHRVRAREDAARILIESGVLV